MSARQGPRTALIRRLSWATLLVLSGVLPGSLGCAEELNVPEAAGVSALRRSFPEQAGKVLEQKEGFVTTGKGFALGTIRALEVELPAEGGAALRFRSGSGGPEVRVRESGVEGAGVIVGRTVAYPRAGGTSFWTTTPGGVEEWLHLEAEAVREGKPAAAWEVEGATVRQQGDAVL